MGGDSDVFGFLVGQPDDQSQHTLTITANLQTGTPPVGSKQRLVFLSAQIFSVSGIKRVWATVLPPGYVPPTISQDFETPDLAGVTFTLTPTSTAGKYQADFAPPAPVVNGTYTVTYFLEDLDGEIVSTAQSQTGAGLTLNVIKGWNLLGARMPIPVASAFADSAKFTSIWKWAGGGWAVRLPKDGDGGDSYAQGKGFTLLADINPGEGFWVNSEAGAALTPSGQPVDGPLTMVSGWNLMGLRSDQASSAADFSAGQGYTSLWKWEGGGWAVYLPGDPDHGAGYALGKGFVLLQDINPGEGFWVNKP